MSLGPIKYQTDVNLKHNALIDNKNQVRLIKYGERVQIHQEGSIYSNFQLVNQDNPSDVGYVRYGDHFVIRCGDQEGDEVYLHEEKDHSLSCEALLRSGGGLNSTISRAS